MNQEGIAVARAPARAVERPRAGRFARSAAVLVSGTVAGQVLIILSSPILTRLFQPEEFGALAVYAAVLAVLTLIAGLRYELAIPLPRTDGLAANLLVLSLIASACVAGLTGLGVALVGERLLALINIPAIAPYLWLVPVGVLMGGSYKALTYWALRKRAFRLIARTRLQLGGGMAVSQVTLGYFQWGVLGLIVGHLAGYALGLVGLLRYTLGRHAGLLRHVRAARIRRGAHRFRDFPLYSTWSSMANVGGTQIPLILFAGLFSPAVAGLYMLAHRVANAPAALVAEAMGKVFMTTAVTARREGTLADLALNVFRMLLRIGLGPLIIIAAIAPEFFTVVFGASWTEAGTYLQFIVPWIAAVVVFAPLSTLYAVMERQKAGLWFQATLLVSRLSALIAGAALGGPLLAVALYAASAVAVYVGFGGWLLNAAGVGYGRMIRTALTEAFVVAPLGGALLLLKMLLGAEVPSLSDPATVVLFAAAVGLLGVAMLRVWPAVKRLPT